jgi:crotonobetainyl-CoA:carnitine CoA-transferase CaiB-like acyl-CoA transferase
MALTASSTDQGGQRQVVERGAHPFGGRTLALDEAVQMMTSAAYMTGPPGRPLRMGASVMEAMGGLWAALGVLVALWERNQTGKERCCRVPCSRHQRF